MHTYRLTVKGQSGAKVIHGNTPVKAFKSEYPNMILSQSLKEDANVCIISLGSRRSVNYYFAQTKASNIVKSTTRHEIGDSLYKIIFDSKNVPKVIKSDEVIEDIETFSDSITYYTSKGNNLDIKDGQDDVALNVWFWSKKEGNAWLDSHKNSLKVSLAVDSKVNCMVYDSVYRTITIKEVRVGGAYTENGRLGIKNIHEEFINMSYRIYVDALVSGHVYYYGVDNEGENWFIIENAGGYYHGNKLGRKRNFSYNSVIQFSFDLIKVHK